MNVIQHKFSFLSLTILLLCFLVEVSYADAIKPPPPPPPIASDTDIDTKKSGKTSTVIDKTTEAQARRQDKPEEDQKQFPAPDLVIRYKDGAKIEEYRVNGQLRYAKITPTSGPAYYLIDTDGDGRFDRRHEHLENPPIQQWLLYSW